VRISPTTANALRTITVANMVMLTVIGAMLGLWMERPAGLVLGGFCWLVAVGLFFVLPLLDPYRNEPGWDAAPDDG
jgi:hypothetical protein